MQVTCWGAHEKYGEKKNQLFYRRLDTKKQKKPQKKSVLVDVPADTCLDSLEAIPSFILNRGHLFFWSNGSPKSREF